MMLSIIVATTRNGVIGRDNKMPWHLPGDLRFFRRITMGKPIIMGRKTHESIGRALPGRMNIIVTRDEHYQAEDCRVAHSLADAIAAAGDVDEVMIAGGGVLYREALPQVQRIYLTRINADIPGDTYFPELDINEWHEIHRETHPADEKNTYSYTNILLERRTS